MNLVPDTKTTWIPGNWRLCTIPIFRDKDLCYDSMYGTCFPLEYDGRLFLVTNEHILKNEKPFLGIRQLNGDFMPLPYDLIEQIGLSWVYHPSLDLAAIPMPTPILNDPNHWSIEEHHWDLEPKLPIGNEVAALGYPKGLFSNFKDGSQGIFPIGLPGTISSIDDVWIKCSCNIQKGASGGPLFFKNKKNTSYLVGVVKGYGEDGDPTIGRCIRIKHVKTILDSKEMKNQIKTFEQKIQGLKNKKTSN
jgi:hypothetical protein